MLIVARQSDSLEALCDFILLKTVVRSERKHTCASFDVMNHCPTKKKSLSRDLRWIDRRRVDENTGTQYAASDDCDMLDRP